MTLPLESLLPLRCVRVQLRFFQDARLRFFHQPAVSGLMRSLMQGELSEDSRLWVETPESGRARYARGDFYFLHLWIRRGGEDLLGRLMDQLRRLPNFPRRDREPTLGPNLAFVGAFDGFTGAAYQGVHHLAAYDAEALTRETAFWLEQPAPRVRILAPLRLLRPKPERGRAKGEARFLRDRGDLEGGLLGERVHDGLAALLRAAGAKTPPRGPGGLRVAQDDCAWVDADYYDERGGRKPMGGLIGVAELAEAPAADFDTLAPWVLGQYTGIGQRRSFGWGRYRLETAEGLGRVRPRAPHRQVLERAAERANLEAAWLALRHPGDSRGDEDGEAPPPLRDEEIAIDPERVLGRIGDHLAAGDYPLHPLEGRILQRPGKHPRPLAVPPRDDRIAQRAVAQVLQSDFAALHAEASFGYRRGRSRQGARERIQTLYRRGYEWVYEADIEEFFDAVPFDRLENRLRSLLPDDPVVDLILAWVRAPVRFLDYPLIERPSGLPQGSPLSPLLANLLLDDFDADLAALGFELVRFADDLVVVCKSRAQAEAAALEVSASLAELGLRIKPEKSRVTAMDRGFRFLGYAFLGDLAVETRKMPKDAPPDPLRPEAVPPLSWLALLLRDRPEALQRLGAPPDPPLRALVKAPRRQRDGASALGAGSADPPVFNPEGEGMAAPSPDEGAPSVAALHSAGSSSGPGFTRIAAALASPETPGADPRGAHLVVLSRRGQLATRNGRLRVTRFTDEADGEGEIAEFPWTSLAAVLVVGNQPITTPCMRAALDHRVPIHFAAMGGRYLGALAAGDPGARGGGLWLRQQERFRDPAFALTLARATVQARLGNQRAVLRQRVREDERLAAPVERLGELLSQTEKARGLPELLGLEGAGSALYFQGFALRTPEAFGFDGRRKHPPRDPVNVLLSLGYTLLHQHADSVLRTAGLYPWIGYYHQPHGRHAALASDLMEPFRHLVERLALAMLGRRQIRIEHFQQLPDGQCRLHDAAARDFMAALSGRFGEAITASDQTAGDLHQHLWRAARGLLDRLYGDAVAPFPLFRIR